MQDCVWCFSLAVATLFVYLDGPRLAAWTSIGTPSPQATLGISLGVKAGPSSHLVGGIVSLWAFVAYGRAILPD